MNNAHEQCSEVARLLQRISDEYEAARRGVAGLAYGTSKHTFVTHKMENMGKLHEKLETLVGKRSAIALIVKQLESCSDITSSSVQELSEEVHTLFDQMQETEVPVIARPLLVPAQLQLGQTSITVDNQEFIEAIGYGLESYFECHSERKQMSAQELLDMWVKVITRDRFADTGEHISYAWRLGFIIREVAGFLNPDVDNNNPALSYLESLSHKCQRLYQSLIQHGSD